jgi:hypothetical protein
MTVAETLHDFDPAPDAPWPPARCPEWCDPYDPHKADDPVLDRLHIGTTIYVDLSIPYHPHAEQWVAVSSRQAEGRDPVVEFSDGGRTILLTGQEALELAHTLVEAAGPAMSEWAKSAVEVSA